MALALLKTQSVPPKYLGEGINTARADFPPSSWNRCDACHSVFSDRKVYLAINTSAAGCSKHES